MTLVWLLNILTVVAFFGIAVVPLLISIRVKVFSLRILSLLLALFAMTHGLYHLSLADGLYFWAEVVFEPVSIVFLLAFGIYYSKKAAF